MTLSSNNISSHSQTDGVLLWGLRLLSLVAGVILLLVIAFLVLESWPALHHIGPASFVTDEGWYPTEGLYRVTPMMWGTLWAALGSIILAAPLGILSAVFCQYYAPPRLAFCYRRLIELLAGIPSVVYGLWGLVVLVPLLGRLHPPGPSLLAGILVLFLMVLPTIMLVAHASFSHVPVSYIQSAMALGFGRWSMIWKIVLPSAKAGLFTGILLGISRALGETMAILMVAGNVIQTPSSLFDPVRTLTANIALEMSYALGIHRSALFVSGLLLLGIGVTVVLMAENFRQSERYVVDR